MGSLIFRSARSTDAPALVALLQDRHEDSRFAGVSQIDAPHARKLMAQAAHRHGNTNDGGCWLEVAESERGIEAFMMGALSRVYLIYQGLCAQDVFLIGRKDCRPNVLNRLVDGYIQWASDNPRVVEIQLSWSDALPSGHRFHSLYKRRGFTRCGEVFRRTVDAAPIVATTKGA